MKKGGLHVHLTNRVAYTLIAFLMLAIVGVGVYAVAPTTSQNVGTAVFGHTLDEVKIPSTCTGNNKLLQYSSGTWSCVALPSSSQWVTRTGGLSYGDGSVLIGSGTFSTSYKLDVGGDIRASSFLYNSDVSLKKNIAPLSNSLDKVKQLQGVSFNWKENGNEGVGLIAQDVEKVFPELVSTDNEGLKSVEYGNLVAPLIEAIKEQQKQIDELKKEIERLNGK